MGKVLIIKGADFHENSLPMEDYVLPLTTLDGETNIVTNIHLMGNQNPTWVMKVEAIKNYPSGKTQGYPMSFGGHFNGLYRRVGLAMESIYDNKFYTIDGLTGVEEPISLHDYKFSNNITQVYLRRLNNVVSYSINKTTWVDLFTISNITLPEKHDCYLCFGNYTPPTGQSENNYFIGTVQAKVCFGVSDASFDF